MIKILVSLLLVTIVASSDPLERFFIKIDPIYPRMTCTPGSGCKTYYLSRTLTAHWNEANQYCRIFGLELLRLENEDEAEKFLDKLENYKSDMTQWNHINGITPDPKLKSKTDWYMLEPFTKINYTMRWKWILPNNGVNPEHCLCINRGDKIGVPALDDIPCTNQFGRVKFFCQKEDAPNETLNMIDHDH